MSRVVKRRDIEVGRTAETSSWNGIVNSCGTAGLLRVTDFVYIVGEYQSSLCSQTPDAKTGGVEWGGERTETRGWTKILSRSECTRRSLFACAKYNSVQ